LLPDGIVRTEPAGGIGVTGRQTRLGMLRQRQITIEDSYFPGLDMVAASRGMISRKKAARAGHW